MKIILLQYYVFLSSGSVTLKLLNLKTLIIIELILSKKWKEIIFINKGYSNKNILNNKRIYLEL